MCSVTYILCLGKKFMTYTIISEHINKKFSHWSGAADADGDVVHINKKI